MQYNVKNNLIDLKLYYHFLQKSTRCITFYKPNTTPTHSVPSQNTVKKCQARTLPLYNTMPKTSDLSSL